MAYIHTLSSECLKHQLDLFALPSTQISMECADTIHCSPTSSLENEAPIEFIIPESEDHYIDPAETYIYIALNVYTAAGANLADDDAVAPVNNFLFSLFSDVSVYMNSKLISPPSQNFAFRSYLENLFNSNKDGKDSYLQSVVWKKDTAGNMNPHILNTGFQARRVLIQNSRLCSMMGRLTVDIFGQSKLIPNNVPLRVVFTRSRPNFCLMATAIGAYSISICKAELHVKRIKINPSILIAHNKLLAEDHTAKFPINRVEVKTFTVQAGGLTFEQRIISGQEPIRIILGLIANNAINDITRNPYNFLHYNLNYLSLTRNGVPVTTRPLQPNFATRDTVETYLNLFRYGGCSEEGFGFDLHDFNAGGYVLYCFDLTVDQSAASHQWSLRRHSVIEVFLRFNQAIITPLSLVVFAEFQNLIELDNDRKVSLDF